MALTPQGRPPDRAEASHSAPTAPHRVVARGKGHGKRGGLAPTQRLAAKFGQPPESVSEPLLLVLGPNHGTRLMSHGAVAFTADKHGHDADVSDEDKAAAIERFAKALNGEDIGQRQARATYRRQARHYRARAARRSDSGAATSGCPAPQAATFARADSPHIDESRRRPPGV